MQLNLDEVSKIMLTVGAIIGTIGGVFGFITLWLYNGMKSTIERLDKEVASLKAERNKWYRLYHGLKLVVKRHNCKRIDCPIIAQLDEYTLKEKED